MALKLKCESISAVTIASAQAFEITIKTAVLKVILELLLSH